MTESYQDIVTRIKAKQREWWKHLKGEGWHLCSICKKTPIAADQKICGFCDHKMRRGMMPRIPEPDIKKRELPGAVKPQQGQLPLPAKKEEPDDNK